MNKAIWKGISYGMVSGVITTLGLFVGLISGSGSKGVVLAGLFTIAFADSLSDALGMHVSEEAEGIHTKKEIWEATIAVAISKLLLSLTFVLPVLIFNLYFAAMVNLLWGVILVSALSFYIAKDNGEKGYKVITEHLLIAILVVIASYFIGEAVNYLILK
jgi:VIT1/CCC1 family predicted Fe2+/Mn2+ transporter